MTEEGALECVTQRRHTESAASWACFSFKCQTDRSDPIALHSTVARIAAQPDPGAVWRYRRGYRFRVVEKPFHRWLLFYRRPAEDCVELVDIVRGERDLTRKPA